MLPENNIASLWEVVIDTSYSTLKKKITVKSNESYKKECANIDTLLFTQVDGIIASMANETVDLSYYEKIKYTQLLHKRIGYDFVSLVKY